MSIVAKFQIECFSCIDADGHAVAELPEFALDRDVLIELYRWMVLTRAFDERAITLQRTGRLGTYASSLGQEAVGVGLAHAMLAEDVLLPSFREHGAQLVRGVTAGEILQFWGGDERGSDFSGPRSDFPVSIPVASQAAHAVGAALAFKLSKAQRVAVAVLGDGATSKGDFYESLNIAGAWNLPVVFVVANNQWAISVPRADQTAAATLAQKAVAAGITGLQVDGNDVVVVRKAVSDALEQARNGSRPCLIEALTYRLSDHTTVDDASRYRDDEEVSAHWQAEPIARLRKHLIAVHGWTKEEESDLVELCAAEVDESADAYLAESPQPPETIFDYTYASLPQSLVKQRGELLALLKDADNGTEHEQ